MLIICPFTVERRGEMMYVLHSVNIVIDLIFNVMNLINQKTEKPKNTYVLIPNSYFRIFELYLYTLF